jgi:hypothetical protein
MEIKEILDNLPLTLEQVKLVITDRKYGMGITCAYYVGGTLCVDIFDKGHLDKVMMVNISTETATVYECRKMPLGVMLKQESLLCIASLKRAFDIYKVSRGETEYYYECLNKSCIRHLILN